MLNGIDVSSAQADININQVDADVVVVKATEGTGYTNPYWVQQIPHDNHRLVGFYHFADGYNYQAEADHFLSTIKGHKYDFIALDYESNAVTLGGVSWASLWLDYVYCKTGVRPLIYMGLSDENHLNWNNVAKNYKLWVAQYNSMDVQYGYKPRKIYGSVAHWSVPNLAMFQYSPNGRLNYYTGALDLDMWYGSKTSKKNKKKVDDEMSWSILVNPTDCGGFKVTKKAGATLWNGPNNDKKTGKIKYGTNWLVLKEQEGFLKLGKNQWADSRTGILKLNPLAKNPKMHAKAEVVAGASGHAKPNGPVTGSKFKVGSRWAVSEMKEGYLKVGKGKNKWLNGEKCKIVL